MSFKSLDELLAACTNLWPGDEAAAKAALARQDTLTKPQGSLGRLVLTMSAVSVVIGYMIMMRIADVDI